ncbi:ATP-binding protein [Actinomadura viridis]|uniref:ATP-binding protein n=1 Tax=Actinomadura viridis TaxID=58110 RepID=UPI0036A505F5
MRVLSRRYLASRSVVKTARHVVESTVLSWGAEKGRAADAALVTSELVTNAVAAAPYGEIRLTVFLISGGLAIEVWDSSSRVPAPRTPEVLAEVHYPVVDDTPDPGGWGLGIVDGLSLRSGFRCHAEGGKTVYAVLPWT